MSFFANRRRGSFNPPNNVTPYTPVATSFVWVKDPSTVNIHAFGLTDTVLAQVLDQRLAPMVPQPAITYTSGTPANLSISGNVLTAVANGTSLITATTTGFANLTGTATSQQVVASITGVSSPLNTDDASSGTFVPVAKDSTNHTVTSATFTFTSLSPSIITVNSSGNWAGQSAGNTTINIVSGSVTFPVACNVTHATTSALNFSSVSPTTVTQGSSSTWTFNSNNANSTTVPVFSIPGDFTVTAYDYSNLGFGFFTATVTVGASATIGTDTVKLHDTSATHTDSPTLNISVVAAVVPTFTSITPNTINQNTSGTFSIVGTGLNSTQTLNNLPFGLSAGTFSASSSTAATVTINASASATLGAASIKIHDSVNGDSNAQTLTVNAGTPNGTPRSSFYLNGGTPANAPTGSKSLTLPLSPTFSNSPVWRQLSPNISASNDSEFVQASGGASNQSVQYDRFASAGLSEQLIPAGTYTVNTGFRTEGTVVGLKVCPIVYIYRPGTASVVSYLRDSATGLGSAIPTSAQATPQTVTFSLASSIAIQSGDILCIEVWLTGTGSDFCHFDYNGNTGDFIAQLIPPASIYTAPIPLGIVSIGPTGISSSTASPTITPISVSNTGVSATDDADFRSKMINSGVGTLWDSTQTSRLGGAAGTSPLDSSSVVKNDLCLVDGTKRFTDRDTVVRNTFQVKAQPSPNAPLSSANDSYANSSSVPELRYFLPAGITWTDWYTRQLYYFTPGYRLDCPNNTVSNASGFNSTQSGAYKIGPHPSNNTTRADLEITGGQNYGSEYLTANFGAICTTDNNYIVGAMSTLMPGWNTGGDVWELIRVCKTIGTTQIRQAMYIGKVTDAFLVKVADVTKTLATAGTAPAMTECGIIGKNYNRQLASTDATPTINFSRVEFANVSDPAFVWPAQIQVADRI